MRRYSPYNYGFNNPIRFVDPDGMESVDWGKINGVWVWDEDIENEEQAKKAGYSDYRVPGSVLENARIGPNGAVGSVRLGNSASDVSYVLTKGSEAKQPGIFDRFASWLRSFQSKDANVGSGWQMFNNGNGMGPDPDAHLNSSSKSVSSLGDISGILSYTGQLRTNTAPSSIFKPFDTFVAADNASQGALGSYVSKGFEEIASAKSVLTQYILDDEKGDTVTRSTQSRRYNRANSGSYLYRNPDGTLTTIPKNP